MDNIILGLLLLQPRTIYQLRKRIDEGLNLIYSCSTGSIQAAIKKLLKKGYIYFDEIIENGKRKKIYCITDSGKESFNAWINNPTDENTVRNPELAKIYFLGFSEKNSRIKLIEKRLSDMQKIYRKLIKICGEGEISAGENTDNDILHFQLQTAKYGRDFMKFNIEWYSRLLKETREK